MTALERRLCEAARAWGRGEKADLPATAGPLVSAFIALSEARSYHANGPNPIAFTEIEAFCRLMNVPFRPDHIAVIRAMDAAWCSEYYSGRGDEEGGSKPPPTSQRPLTARLFDVMAGEGKDRPAVSFPAEASGFKTAS